MSGNIDPQELATRFLMGDHIREDICSRTGLPIQIAMEVQTRIMACGEMIIELPKTKTGRLKKEVMEKLTDVRESDVTNLADVIVNHSRETKSKPPREGRIIFTIDEIALHGEALSALCNELLTHRCALDEGQLNGTTKGQRSVIHAIALDTIELFDTYGEERFRKGASQFLAKKNNEGQANNATINQLMANILSACFPQANLEGLKKRLQRLRKSK